MAISNRLKIIADLVTEGLVTADIGTDHGYVPIYLLQNKRVPKAIACDLSEGALRKAEENGARCGFVTLLENNYSLDMSGKKPKKIPLFAKSDVIEFRLGNGLEVLRENEAESIVISGMGGILMVNILEAHKEVSVNAKELVLSPHRDADLVREFLNNHGFEIVYDEEIIDKKKKYTIIKGKRQ